MRAMLLNGDQRLDGLEVFVDLETGNIIVVAPGDDYAGGCTVLDVFSENDADAPLEAVVSPNRSSVCRNSAHLRTQHHAADSRMGVSRAAWAPWPSRCARWGRAEEQSHVSAQECR